MIRRCPALIISLFAVERGAVLRRSLVLCLAYLLMVSVVWTGGAAGAEDVPVGDLSAKCRGGDGGKCLEAGNRYRFGKGAPMDPVLAAEHYALACREGYDYGCKPLHQVGLGFLGGKDHRGKKAVEDHGKAAEVFDLACSGNYGPGCTSLGAAYRDGDGVEKNAARATELFVLGCENGSRRGCRLAGSAVAGTDPAGAKGFYEKGCRWKDTASCAALGRMHFEGTGVPKDAKRAFDYFLQSCGETPLNNDSEGCFSLARMYDQGMGAGKDRAEAVRLYRLGCSVFRPKKGEACFLLAQAYKEGDGVDVDANAMAQYFRQACELGIEEGCVEWHLDTCIRLGQPSSCQWLEKEGIKER